MQTAPALRSFTVLIHSGNCDVVKQSIRTMSQSYSSSLRPFSVVEVSGNKGAWHDPEASFVIDGRTFGHRLMDFMAKEMGDLETINLVSVVATESDVPTLTGIDEFVSRLKEVIGGMGQAVCRDFRLAFPAYGSLVPREPFFSQRSDANLISIPRDSSSHESLARPVTTEELNVYSTHVAVELATIVGLWVEMDDSVAADLQRINPGTNDVIVRWVSSRTNYLICPPLPIDRLMSEEGELPLPHGFHPAPDSSQALERLARIIYPDVLRYTPTSPPSGAEYSITGKKLRLTYFKEFVKATTQVPRALFQGVQDHLEGLAGAALQEAVGSSESSIEVVYPGRYIDERDESVSVSSAAVQRIIDEVSERVDRPVLTTIGEGLWVEIVDKVISVADGGTAGIEVRTQFADSQFLLIEQSALAPQVDQLVDVLQHIHVQPRKPLVSAEEVSSDDFQTEDNEQLLSDAEYPEAGVAVETSDEYTNESSEPSPEVGEPEDEGSDTPDSNNLVESFNVEVIQQQESEGLPEVVDQTPRTLVREITSLLASEQENARSRAAEMVQTLIAMPGRFKPRDARTISTSVRVAVALGFSIVYFTFGSLTERRHLVNFESIGASNRDLLWVLLSTLVLGLAGFGVFLGSIGKSQGRVIASVTGLVVILGAEFVFWKSIREFVLRFDAIKGSALIGTLLMLGVIVIVAISVARNRLSENRLRRLFASTLVGLTWLYVLVGVTAVMGSDNSSFRNLRSTTENRLVFMLFLTSLTLIVVSSAVVAYTIVQERYRLNEARRQLRWATSELAESADAERRLRLASVQWLGTAAVLARLFKFPLGSDFSTIKPNPEPVNEASNVLKFEQRPLVLTKRGEQGLSARLRQLFIGQGWLSRQYRQLILRFQDDFAFSRGLEVSEVRSERPEGCTSMPTLEDVFEGRARGSRWSFMKSAFSGEYDSALLDTTSEVQLEDAYSTIVVDSEAHSVGATSQTATSYFQRLVPARQIQIPQGLVSVLFSGTDERRLLTPYLWWPEELLPRPVGNLDGMHYREAPVLTPDRINDPIKLFGACVLVSHPFTLVDISMGAGGIEERDVEIDEPNWGGGVI